MLCAKFFFFLKLAKRFWRRIFLNVLNVFSLFLNYLPLERVWPFIWTNLNSLNPRMFCSKYGLNWPSSSGADIHSYVVIKGRPTPNTMLGYPLPKYLHIIVGSYERPGKTGYKHIYFNATLETLIIWTLTLFTIIIAYEAFKRLFNLYSAGNVRWRMLVLFVLDIYPNYYSYWTYFNYTNDGFYAQFYHQLFFTMTELFSTWNVFWLCSKDFPMTSGPVMAIVTISLIHILLGGVDQFFVQLILWQEHTFQKARNIGFVIPDILHIILTLQEIAKERKTSWKQSFTGNELKYGFIFVISGFILGKIIFR